MLADEDFHAAGGVGAPGHARRVVGNAEATERAEQDDAAVATEAVEEIGDGFFRGLGGRGALLDAIDGPLAEHQFHDGLSPAGERNRGGKIVGVAAAADERRISHASGRFIQRAAGGSSGGKIAAPIESNGADGVVRGAGVHGAQMGCGAAAALDVVEEALRSFCCASAR